MAAGRVGSFPYVPDDTIWRMSSILAAIPPFAFAVTYPSRRYRASGVRMPTGTKVILAFLYLTVLILLFNVSGDPISSGPGLYALGLTVEQFTNIGAFIYALRFVLDTPPTPEQLAN